MEDLYSDVTLTENYRKMMTYEQSDVILTILNTDQLLFINNFQNVYLCILSPYILAYNPTRENKLKLKLEQYHCNML